MTSFFLAEIETKRIGFNSGTPTMDLLVGKGGNVIVVNVLTDESTTVKNCIEGFSILQIHLFFLF